MSDRQKQQISEEQEVRALQVLFDEAAEAEGEALWQTYQAEVEAGAAHEMPEELDAKCRELIQASEKKPKQNWPKKFIGDGLKNVAIIALGCLFLISITAAKVDAIRIPVLNFLADRGGRYSKIQTYEHKNDQGALLSEKVLSAPLPEGYVFADKWSHNDGSFYIRFTNDESMAICVKFFPSDQIINYDVEDAEQTKTKILSHDAILIKKHGLRVIWMDEEQNYVFDVSANGLSEDVFWKYVLKITEL